MAPRLTLLLLVAALVAACRDEAVPAPVAATTSASVAATTSSVTVSTTAKAIAKPTAQQLAAWRSCAERRQEALAEVALPGAAKFEKNRVQMSRVRGRPMLWKRVPGKLSFLLERQLGKSKTALGAVQTVFRKAKYTNLRRRDFLREGYLWADEAALGLALVEQLSLVSLYRHKKLYLQRGLSLYALERRGKSRFSPEQFVHLDGDLEGKPAELLLGDRVAVKRDELTKKPPLGIDLHQLGRSLESDRLRPVHLADKWLVADLRYGPGSWVEALFRIDGARASFDCEVLDAGRAAKKAAFLVSQRRLNKAMARVRRVVRAMVDEQIPFDAAPEQQNGFLRKAWQRAYLKGWSRYKVEGKSRDVYSVGGWPQPPQVCIDFLTDAWERAAGTWFVKAETKPFRAAPSRTEGPIDFGKLGITNRRSVAEFTAYAINHPELFDVWAIPASERVVFKRRKRFFRYLHDHIDKLRLGDMITILGHKGKRRRPHYHSLIILETDLISGMPILVGGNAIRPREQTIEGVMQISPHRTLRHRIRLNDEWLQHVASAPENPALLPELSAQTPREP